MNWLKIGKYLNREVYICEIESLANYQYSQSLTLSSILICFGDSKNNKIEDLQQLINISPVCINLAGERSETYFDLMLDILSRQTKGKHIMTSICREPEVSEWIFDFFSVNFPSEDRFDEWKSYHVFVIGSHSFYDNIFSEINKIMTK
jgi:hypothetical protein